MTTDRDLLDLMHGRDEACKRFRQRLPNCQVLPPEDFVRRYGQEVGVCESA